MVVLGDVAEVNGPPEIKDQFESLTLIRNLMPDTTRLITQEVLKRIIPPDRDVCFYGAFGVEVLSWKKHVNAGDLLSVLQRQFEILCGDSIEVVVEISNPEQKLFTGAAPPVRCSIIGSGMRSPGSQIITIEYVDAHGKTSRFHLDLEISLFASLAYPNELIKREQVIQTEDFQIRTVNLAETTLSGQVYHPEYLVGLQAERHISPGAPIRWDQVRRPPDVLKGDNIDVVFCRENYEIKASAAALESGSSGEKIWIKLENNGKRMRVVVVDADRVTLE